MMNRFRRNALILFLSGGVFACSQVASSSSTSQEDTDTPPDAATKLQTEAEPAPAKETAKETAIPTPAMGFATPSGARVVVSHGARDMTSNGVKEKTIPIVIMLSNDAVAEVASFYTRELAGWQYTEFVGTHMFWQGDPGEHFMEAAGSMTRPYVSIQEYDAAFDLPGAGDAVTMITVAYVPEK